MVQRGGCGEAAGGEIRSLVLNAVLLLFLMLLLPATEPLQLRLPLPMDRAPSESLFAAPVVPAALVEDLHRRLAGFLDESIDLIATDNRRTLISWRRRKSGVLRVRMQRQFAFEADEVIRAAAQLIRTGDPACRALVRGAAQRFRLRPPKRRGPRVQTFRGRHHDLEVIVAAQTRRHFRAPFDGRIGWSRTDRGLKRRTIRLGSWSSEHRLIRIHPALDQRSVPRYVVNFVVFHELLHADLKSESAGGRRIVHSAEFRRREARHPDHDRARRWIDRNLPRLLAY